VYQRRDRRCWLWEGPRQRGQRLDGHLYGRQHRMVIARRRSPIQLMQMIAQRCKRETSRWSATLSLYSRAPCCRQEARSRDCLSGRRSTGSFTIFESIFVESFFECQCAACRLKAASLHTKPQFERYLCRKNVTCMACMVSHKMTLLSSTTDSPTNIDLCV
jgi:hypothetical protein